MLIMEYDLVENNWICINCFSYIQFRNVAYGEDLQVYRENGSPDRQVLMAIRQGDVPLQQAWQIIQE